MIQKSEKRVRVRARNEFDTIAALHYSSERRSGAGAPPPMKLIPASDSSLLAVFGDAMGREIQRQMLGLFHALQARRDTRIRNLHPGYVSLLVDFDPLETTHEEIAEIVATAATSEPGSREVEPRLVEIPVCYDAEFGPDLQDVATHTKLPAEDVVRLHAGATYDVVFLGFTAGFAYLGGMPEILSTPRLATPRRTVAAGSVGIAGGQTGIYPTVTPGGWRLIGRTPLRMFDPNASQPTLVMPGDQLRFVSIDCGEFELLLRERP
jgi:KipI family sensor histidine kinase inhibitor